MKQSTKRIICYRALSITSEFIVVYLLTGSIAISSIAAPVCLVLHTGIHYGIEKIFKDKGENKCDRCSNIE